MTVTIRPAVPGDEVEITAMIHELAAFEKAADQCTVTEAQIRTALFGGADSGQAAVSGHFVEVDGRPAAFALWFLNFSTWDGVSGIYLEDLFVRPGARGSGLGKALLAHLARLCVERDCARLEWSVLDWNTPSIGFYRSLGAKPMDEWTVMRVDGEALDALAGAG